MLSRFSRKKESDLDAPIAALRAEMLEYGPGAPEYQEIFDKYVMLVKLRSEEDRSGKIKPDTLVVVAGNLMGILIIVGYERAHVMTSKGLSFLRPVTQ